MLVTSRLEFDAGHRIPDHQSQCRHLHGHRYAIEVTLSGEIIKADGLPVNGMVMDFADVKRIAKAHVVDLENRIGALQDMRSTLQNLLQHCHGDDRPQCPILDRLAGGS